MKSIWMSNYENKKIKSINEDMSCSVLIIGGGIAGLMCAYYLMKSKIKFVLVDAKDLASGVSANTTAQVSIAHDKLYDDICKKHSKEKAIRYLKSQIEGLNLIKNVIKEEKIECDYKEESTILYASDEKNIKILQKQYELIKDYASVEWLDSIDLLKHKKAVKFNGQFIFNPMKYMMKIIDILIENNVPLYKNSKVTKIKKKNDIYEVDVNNKHKIKTKKIIMACHYPFLNPDNLYFTKIYQSKSYVVAFESKLKLKNNYLSLDKPYYYLRTYDDSTLIIGGSDHYTGLDIDIGKCYDTLIDKIYKLDKDAKVISKWFTEDCMPIDSFPFAGEYSKINNNILLVTGFQKWGFTNSHIIAKTISNMLSNKEYDDLYKTNRFTLLKDLKSTFRMIVHSINGLIVSKLAVKKYELDKIKVGSGKVTKIDNVNVLVYRKNKKEYLFLKNKCTHLGCSLIWNNVDKLWECKCHGSIFDRYGKVIYGPALKDLEKIDI
ncbi:MAG: FAD-dependent oxidoreductase [Bacilli bacterium]|nr:FAD-dependent oxidoreductase [Bacilli bacterium]MDD4733319.1 FAD-dependent oxidoreductase [Bacilli bacterium]